MRTWTIVLVDLLAAALGVTGAAAIVQGCFFPGAQVGFTTAAASSLATVAAAVVVAYLMGLHEASVVTDKHRMLSRTFFAGAVAAASGAFTSYAVWFIPAGRLTLLFTTLFVSACLALWRLAYGSYLIRGPRIPVLVLGTSESAIRFAHLINGIRHTRYVVVGFVGDEPPKGHNLDDDVPYFGSPRDALEICREHGVAMVAVATNGETPKWFRMLGSLQLDGIRITTAGALSMQVAKQIPLDVVTAHYLLDAFEQLDRPLAARMKRMMDVIVASAGLAVFSLMLPALYAMVKLSSEGPFFYSQERVGLGGRSFRLFKIRTMAHRPANTEQRWASEHDDRVTRVGRFLRQTRIDEMPQFWNVLRGEMSVVGPRPEQPDIARTIEAALPAFAYRTLVRPGITGWAQIHHGYADSIQESAAKLSYDLYYVKQYEVILDVAVILRTISVMLFRTGSR